MTKCKRNAHHSPSNASLVWMSLSKLLNYCKGWCACKRRRILPAGDANCRRTLLQPRVMMKDCFPTRLHSVSRDTEHLKTHVSSSVEESKCMEVNKPHNKTEMFCMIPLFTIFIEGKLNKWLSFKESLNSFCPYSWSQWGPKQHWTLLTVIICTKQNFPHKHLCTIGGEKGIFLY